VASQHYWGAETQRSIHFFGYGERCRLGDRGAFGPAQGGLREVNATMGLLAPETKTAAIVARARKVASAPSIGRISLARLAGPAPAPRTNMN